MLDVYAYHACRWEATARKAGNVHPGADFDNLTYRDFLLSAAAVAPVLARAPESSLGETVLQSIAATRQVVATNTNLGIVLLLAPLAKAAHPRRDLEAILSRATVRDAALVYEAVRLANPGGLGKVDDQDVRDEPTAPLREVMALAADRDAIARQYANGFRQVLDEGIPALLAGHRRFGSIEAAVIACQLFFLSHYPDSLIVRKRGPDVAGEVVKRSAEVVERGIDTIAGRSAYGELDRWLRQDGHARNPGTTADLTAACLFVALREHTIKVDDPFDWEF